MAVGGIEDFHLEVPRGGGLLVSCCEEPNFKSSDESSCSDDDDEGDFALSFSTVDKGTLENYRIPIH